MLTATFDNETAAAVGPHAPRQLHFKGDTTLHGTGVTAKDTAGRITVKQTTRQGPVSQSAA